MENESNRIVELARALDYLKGKVCWSLISGEGSGSLVSIAFGEKVKRKRRLRNQSLTDEERNFEGEFELYVQCAWRLQTEEEVICSSTSSNHRGGARETNLRSLIGSTVSSATVTRPAADLEIVFAGKMRLLVFADQANEVDEIDNFVLYAQTQIITNGARSRVNIRPRVPGLV
jgi:hypothetical protein